MRIVIDLQGAQASSRHRGMGRYSYMLSYYLCKYKGEHDIHLVLNSSFSDGIEEIHQEFEQYIPRSNIHIFNIIEPTSAIDSRHTQNRQASEAIREAFLGELEPDVVLITSLFEGFMDNAVTSINKYTKLPTAVVLYDLIPYIHQNPYLNSPVVSAWYLNKIESIKQADFLLSISQSSGQEAVDWLYFDPEQVVNISTATDDRFKPIMLSAQDKEYLQSTYNLGNSFVMYTGGIDHRKNIEGLIRSFAALPSNIRKSHQLAIVCAADSDIKKKYAKLARDNGLARNEFIMTGFVPEEDLVKLYNACKLFIFPSWHEGFGLPALEAMLCGRPVIASNNSSLPEVVGLEEALFDPLDDKSITAKMLQGLTDESFRQRLINHGLQQAKKFNWDTIAQTAIVALEKKFSQSTLATMSPVTTLRPKLAYLSPLPPERSGISDYSAELLEELTRYYKVDVIVNQAEIENKWIHANCTIRDVDWFRDNHNSFDRVLYHFGNSHFHTHMFELIQSIPGVVVLHDFFLSGIQFHKEMHEKVPHNFTTALYQSHGYASVVERYVKQDAHVLLEVVEDYPANFQVLQDALGVIVHSHSSIRLAKKWYNLDVENVWKQIPLLRTPPAKNNKKIARQELGLEEDAFLICSFGIVAKPKESLKLVQAFLQSSLAKDKNCYLIFVGMQDGSEYSTTINKLVESTNMQNRIITTGWVDLEDYKNYLQVADIGVQLRTMSRGETSASVLDCMNYGLPTVVNANGSMADLNTSCVYMLPDEFEVMQLANALDELFKDKELRIKLGKAAKNEITTVYSPKRCAQMYMQSIEDIYAKQANGFFGLLRTLSKNEITIDTNNTDNLSKLSENFPPKIKQKQVLVDISEMVHRFESNVLSVQYTLLLDLLKLPTRQYRIEPIYQSLEDNQYYYARNFCCKILGLPKDSLVDEAVEAYSGDVFLSLFASLDLVKNQELYYKKLKNHGIELIYILESSILESSLNDIHYLQALQALGKWDRVICFDSQQVEIYLDWLQYFSLDETIAIENLSSINSNETLAESLLSLIDSNSPYKIWKSDGTLRFKGNDPRLSSQVGEREKNATLTTEQAGFLIYGPYLPFKAGTYRIEAKGKYDIITSHEYFDMCIDNGQKTLFKQNLQKIAPNNWQISHTFKLEEDTNQFEIRLWVSENSVLSIEDIIILSIDNTTTPRLLP